MAESFETIAVDGVDTVVLALGRVACTELYAALK